MVSWFFFIKNRKNPYVKDTDFQKFVEKSNFDQFIKFIFINLDDKSLLKRPYLFYMCDKNIFKIDYVIRYENYESDIDRVLTLLKVRKNNNNVKYSKKRTCGLKYNYRDFYNKETKSIVENIYCEDINFFKYSF